MSKEELQRLRHSTSHIMAQAIKRLFPDVKFAIGPAINTGFYYDLEVEHKFSEADFPDIEKEMQKIIKENHKFAKKEVTRHEALELMHDQPYKIELIKEMPEDEIIYIYTQGEFIDLCAGPHIESTEQVKAFKLMSVAGAYWHGDEKNKMLQRIYGTAFETKQELDNYILQLEEAKKRDHRKLGAELELYTLMEEGVGFPFFLPNGMAIRNELENFWRNEHIKNGYREIRTPIMLNEELWYRSGHWEHYKDNMYFSKIGDKIHALKPMNCPGSILVYKMRPRSYRELPLRLAEMGVVHRHENSGNLHGLMRVRCFTQDDAHIYVTQENVIEELTSIMKLIDKVYKVFDFEYSIELSTRPESSMGTDEQWEMATNGLKEALKSNNVEYTINEGDGAFYGPKIDFHLHDSIGRVWQCGTIQLDFQMPERFGIEYIKPDGTKGVPIMVHRVIFGSIERFIGILVEHFAANFPTWLAPIQVSILPISEKHINYATQLENEFKNYNIRVKLDESNEKLNKKIRNTFQEKIPYCIIVGDNEIKEQTITIRNCKTESQQSMNIKDFINLLQAEINARSLKPQITVTHDK